MGQAERRRRLKRIGWAFHVPGSLLVAGGLITGTPVVLLAGAALIAVGFRCFFRSGRLPR